MKKFLLKYLLISCLFCLADKTVFGQAVVFTSLQGFQANYIATGNSNLVPYGFSVFVPASGTFNPGPLYISTSSSLNGYVSAMLNQTSKADPTLATTAALNTYGVNINSPLQVGSFPNLTGAAGTGTTYYYYLVLSNSNSANPPPTNFVYSLPSASTITQNGYSGGITINNTNSATYNFGNVKPTITYPNQAYTLGTAVSPNAFPTNTGSAGTSYTISPGLPAGLSFSPTTGVISGTPTAVSLSQTYTVVATNSYGSGTTTFTLSVGASGVAPTVTTTAPSAIASTSATVGGTIASIGSSAITSYGVVYSTSNNTPTTADSKFQIGTTGGTFPGSYSSSLTGLTSSTLYYIRAYATNGTGTSYGAATNFTTTVVPPSISYTTPQTLYLNNAVSITPSNSGGVITSASSSPALPAGLSVSSAGVITGTPTSATAAANYTITATNGGGSVTATINITVIGTPTISYSTPQTYYTGNTITTLTPTSSNVSAWGTYATGTSFGTGAPAFSTPWATTFDASGNFYVSNVGNNLIYKYNSSGVYQGTLGTGLNQPIYITFDASNNAYVTNYGANSITKVTSAGVSSTLITGLSNPFGADIDASGNIYVANYNGGSGSYVSKYSSTGTFISSFTSATADNVVLDASGNIYVLSFGSGTVTKYNSLGTLLTTYSTGLTTPFGLTIDGSGNFYLADEGNNRVLVYDPTFSTLIATVATGTGPTGVAVDASGNIYVVNSTSGTVTKYVSKGGYYISTALPAGLSFSSSTGAISGTPTAVSATTSYTITAFNPAGSGTAPLSITVSNPTAPTAPSVSNCGDGTFTLTASGSVPSGGTYNWYSAATGGTLLSTGATYSPNVVTTTTFYVSYTSGTYTTSRTAVTATVYPIVSSPLSSQFFAYPFSAGSLSDISGNSNTGHLQFVSPSVANATTSADRYGTATSAYTFDGQGQNLYTTTQIANPGPNTFTISLWFNTTSVTGGKLMGFENNQTGGGQFDRNIYMDKSGLLYYGVYVSGFKVINSTAAYNDGKWHHVVITMGSTNGAVMYIDDVTIASNATITSGEPHSGYWLIGGGQLGGWPSTNGFTSNFFAGQIDDVAVYSTEQTAAQVVASDNLNLIGTTATAVCAGSPISFTAPTITGATYTWTDPGGNTQTGQNPTFASAIAGTYSLSVTGGPGSCTSTASITPTINTLPSATFTAPSTVITGANATVTFTGTYNAAYTYAWNFNGGTPATGTGQGPFSVSWATGGTKTITLTVTNPTTGCVATATQTVTVGTSYNTYGYSLPLTINSTSLGMTTDQTNFPFLLTITDPSLVITSGGCSNKIQYPTGNGSGYYDMAFVVSGAEIPYQVESYNTTTGKLLVWVKLPTLSHSANSTVTFYYGSGTANSSNNYNSVWSTVVAASGTSYSGVWHFNEVPSTSTSTLTDATGNGNSLIASSSTNVTQNTASLISNGITLNGATVSKTGVTNFASLALNSSISMSAWVYYTVSPSGNSNPMALQSASGYDQLEFRTPNNYIGLYGNGGNIVVAGTTVPATGAWHYLVYTYNGTTNNFYVDGALNATSTTAPNTGTITNLFFGSYGVASGEYYYGNIDESRVIGTPLTTDWIKAEYNNQSNPASYTSTGTMATYFANASALKGGITYSTADGASYNYTINSTTTTATPPTNGTANITVTGGSAALSAGLTIYQLTVNSSDQIDLNGQTMNVGCNVFNNGTITNSSATGASLIFNGSASTQTYTAGSSSNTTTVDNLTINNSAAGTITLSGGPVNVTNILTLTSGNLTISTNTGTAFTLKSTATQTASVAQISSGTITGNAYVERYIAGGTSHRGYRFMSVPVNQGSSAGVLSGQPYYGFTDLQSTTIITGYGATGAYSSSTQPASGFDPSANGNPSVFFYNEPSPNPVNTAIANSDYKGISTINEKLPVGNGFLFFFRGNRNVLDGNSVNKATTAAVPENTTFRYYGNLNQGTINVYIPTSASAIQNVSGHSVYVTPSTAVSTFTYTSYSSYNDGYQLVGNPYASAIDLEKITLNSPYNKFVYMLNDAGTLGFYTIGTNTTYTSSNSLTGNLHNNGVGRYVMPGQGFFIKANTPTGTTSLTFTEACKVPFATVTSYGTPTLFQYARPDNLASLTDSRVPAINAALASSGKQSQMIHIRLSLDSLNENEAVIRFGEAGASNKFNGHEDAYYAYGLSQTTFMATYTSDTQPMLFNEMGSLDSIKSVPLYAEGQTTGVYKMTFTGASSVDPRYKLYLKDNLLKDSLDLSANSVYTFNIDRANTQTYGSNRFTLIVAATNIANYYNLSAFTGIKQTGGDLISWQTQYEGNYTGFVLQRSTDGFKTFTVLDSLQSDGRGGYSFLDTKPFMGVNQYRLVQNNINNVNSLSNIVTISYQPLNAITDKFQIYPNPAVSVINLKLNVINNPVTIFAKVYSTNGMLLINAKYSSASTLSQDVSKLIKGTYVVKVTDSNNKDYGTALFTKL